MNSSQIVIVKSPDGLEIHDQLFLPKDLKPGDGLVAYPDVPFSFWWYMWPRPVSYPTHSLNYADPLNLDQLITEIQNKDRTFVLFPKYVDLDFIRMKIDMPVTVLSSRPKHTLVVFANEAANSVRP